MQQYSTYKPSNVEWLGEIPNHWEIERLKDVCENITSGGTPKTSIDIYWENGDIIWVTPTDFQDFEKTDYINNSRTRITAAGLKDCSASILPIGTVVMQSRASIGLAKISATELCTNQGFINFTGSHALNNKFLFYLINVYLGEYFQGTASGTTYMEIPRSKAKQEKIPLPPFTEQTAIAAYLDQATANIDKVISTKQKQLEKLEQYKQSKIHECVTKGLNPDVTLKPSGIDWIGNVPSHWKVERLKYVVSKIGSGVTPKGGAAVYSTTGIPLIRSQNVHFDGLNFYDIACITDEIHDDMSGSKVKRGDVLLNITGASIGRCYYYNLDDEANVNQHVCILRPNELMSTNFLYYLMMSEVGQSQIFSGFKGSGREGLGNESIKVFKIPLPKTKEQREISDYLDFFSDNIKKEKDIIELQIEKLKQYRKCLIHECVTGKRKVVND